MSSRINLHDPENKDRESWNKWGLYQHTEDEIREKFLTDPDNICICFLIDYSVPYLSDKFIEEAKVLSILNPLTDKPFINKDNYDRYCSDFIRLYSNIKKGTHYKTKKETRILISNIPYFKQNLTEAENLYKKVDNKDKEYRSLGYDQYSFDTKDKYAEWERNNNLINGAKTRYMKAKQVYDEAYDFVESGRLDKSNAFYKTYIFPNIQDRFTSRNSTYKELAGQQEEEAVSATHG